MTHWWKASANKSKKQYGNQLCHFFPRFSNLGITLRLMDSTLYFLDIRPSGELNIYAGVTHRVTLLRVGVDPRSAPHNHQRPTHCLSFVARQVRFSRSKPLPLPCM